MLAAVLFGPGDLRVVEIEQPKPGPGEVLIRVEASAICGSDLAIASRPWDSHPPFGSYVPGHEFSGTVVQVGETVDEFTVGDRVALHVHKGCGRCANCMRGLYTACLNYGRIDKGHRAYGITANGGFAQYATVHVSNLYKLPERVSFEDACVVTNAACGLYGLETTGSPITGETVVVIGPGPIGLMVVQLCRAYAARMVILSGTRPDRLRLGSDLGADRTVNVRESALVPEVERITNGEWADLGIDCSGTPEGVRDAIAVVKRGGKVLLLGNSKEPATIDAGKIVSQNLTVYGARGEGARAAGRALELMAQGRISGARLITHRFPLRDIGEALQTFAERKGGAIKVVLEPWR